MRLRTGADIIDVCWFDADRRTVGLVVRDRRDPPTAWAGEWSLSEFDAATVADLRSEAAVLIEGGEISRSATS